MKTKSAIAHAKSSMMRTSPNTMRMSTHTNDVTTANPAQIPKILAIEMQPTIADEPPYDAPAAISSCGRGQVAPRHPERWRGGNGVEKDETRDVDDSGQQPSFSFRERGGDDACSLVSHSSGNGRIRPRAPSPRRPISVAPSRLGSRQPKERQKRRARAGRGFCPSRARTRLVLVVGLRELRVAVVEGDVEHDEHREKPRDHEHAVRKVEARHVLRDETVHTRARRPSKKNPNVRGAPAARSEGETVGGGGGSVRKGGGGGGARAHAEERVSAELSVEVRRDPVALSSRSGNRGLGRIHAHHPRMTGTARISTTSRLCRDSVDADSD